MTTWYVYRFTRAKRKNALPKFELLETIDAPNQSRAWGIAMKRWPELARAAWPEYRNGRLTIRSKRLTGENVR